MAMSKVCLKVLAGSRECCGLVVESRLISTTHHLLSTTICASVYQLIIGCTRAIWGAATSYGWSDMPTTTMINSLGGNRSLSEKTHHSLLRSKHESQADIKTNQTPKAILKWVGRMGLEIFGGNNPHMG